MQIIDIHNHIYPTKIARKATDSIRDFYQLDGGGINLVGAGYYAADVSISFAPAEAGDVTFQLLQDGIAIPGATATLTGAAGETACASISALARNCGCNCNTTLTLTVSAAGTFANFATRVIKG